VDQHPGAGVAVHELGHGANPEHGRVGTRQVGVAELQRLQQPAARRVKLV
jgi:hypothetical protein